MIRPTFPPRPPGTIGMLQPLVRPPVPGIRGVPPVATAVVRPVVPIVAPTEKPQTIVYIGKIASTVENDFILSLLRVGSSFPVLYLFTLHVILVSYISYHGFCI